ncbi:carbonic anhydrase-like [Bacillus rossius redtenbacheri]|uniref:carbonic anhydrase-like n=1 Tax=Bacillus rossius redtenbacheri TaxID=93214 RepID=UPI002FDD205E
MEGMRCLLVIAVFGGSKFANSASPTYDYEAQGPRTWPRTFPMCNGSMQSPIDVPEERALSSELPPLVYQGYWDRRVEATLTNTGLTAEVSVEDWPTPATLSGGPLRGVYQFSNLHFHWGPNSSVGSEHTLTGERYSMEAHVVHFKQEYGNVTNAYSYPDGIAVVAFFLEVDSWIPNLQLSRLVEAVMQVEQLDSTATLPLRDATKWFHHDATESEYYTYQGSLTTPPCYQVATWIIYPSVISMAERQVAVFRRLRSTTGSRLTSNYRPIQPLNGREVEFAEGNSGQLNHLGEGYVRV